VTANPQVVPGIFRLSFPRIFDFVPGQLVALTTDPLVPVRFYSIASGSGEPQVDILFDLVPQGLLTPRLARLAPGDTLYVSPPFGRFVDSEGPSFWVAAGTGVAPFLSMLRSGLREGKTLVQGSRTVAGLLERGLFADALRERYLPCCSRKTPKGYSPGRTTEWLTTNPLPPFPASSSAAAAAWWWTRGTSSSARGPLRKYHRGNILLTPVMKENLFGKTIDQLSAVAQIADLPRFAARQMCDWLYRKDARSLSAMTNLPRRAPETLSELYDIEPSAAGQGDGIL